MTLDRSAGVLLAQACGDALGAPTEFQPAPLPATTPVAMTGGGSFGWEPGEWTDDTQMSIAILQAAEAALADGVPLIERLDDIAATWVAWERQAKDVGTQTRGVLMRGGPTAAGLRAAAREAYRRGERSAGNGSLMRTAPVALALLGHGLDADRMATAETARAISDLTHADPDAGDACVLWCAAIQHAIYAGEFDVLAGLDLLPTDRRDLWHRRVAQAHKREPWEFTRNGWVVEAFQAAWSLIVRTPVPQDAPELGSYPADHLRLVLEKAARLPGDTDTVGAIAGALVGGRWGASAVPATWRRVVHGWPGMTGVDLARRGLAVAQRCVDDVGWPLSDRVSYDGWDVRGRLVQHPHDAGVWLGDVAVAEDSPAHIDAVISLCRMGIGQIPRLPASERVTVWLIDEAGPSANPNLDFVLADTADVIAEMRAEGRTVLAHCVVAQSRTPTVGAAYSIRHRGIDADRALDEVCAALPDASPHGGFQRAVRRVAPAPRSAGT